MKIRNMFKKTHKRLVYGTRLTKIIDIMDELGIEITGVKKYKTVKMTEDIDENLYVITYKASEEKHFDVLFELRKDPKVGGDCSDF